MRKPNRRCCFEQNSAGRPNVNRLKVAAVLAIRDIGIPKPLNVEFHLCLHIEIGHGKSGMMDRPFGQRPGSLPSVVNQHIDCFCSTACAKRVSAISTVIPDRLQIPCVAHERVRSEEPTSELQSLMRISYAVFC